MKDNFDPRDYTFEEMQQDFQKFMAEEDRKYPNEIKGTMLLVFNTEYRYELGREKKDYPTICWSQGLVIEQKLELLEKAKMSVLREYMSALAVEVFNGEEEDEEDD